MKIAILGYSGSGKSTFAYKLGLHYQIDPTHIDKLHFKSGWIEQDTKIRNEAVESIILKDTWILEGNYQKIATNRYERADQIFIFNFNRIKCLYGAIVRRIKYHKKERRSMTKGNFEKLDFEFFWWIVYKSRTKKRRQIYRDLRRDYPDKVVIFKTRRHVNRYLKSIGIDDFKERS